MNQWPFDYLFKTALSFMYLTSSVGTYLWMEQPTSSNATETKLVRDTITQDIKSECRMWFILKILTSERRRKINKSGHKILKFKHFFWFFVLC